MPPSPPKCRRIADRTRVSVAFHHVDMMQIVHNTQYFKWFEAGRLGILDRFIPVDYAMENGLAVPVVMNTCEYYAPARYGDSLIVTTTHLVQPRWTGRFCFEHSISNAKTKIELCRGKSDVTVMSADAGRVLKVLPEGLWERYTAI